MRVGRLIAAVMVLAAAGGGAWWAWGRPAEAPTWRTATLERQDVRQVVSATGTLEAVQTVEVGAQVSGIVAALGADFNDRVEAGQVLARIDPALLSADVASAAARLAEEKALAERLALALDRVERLHAQRITTDDERDEARANHAVALAQVRAAEVALDRARRNLSYATIAAPISGTVIRRDVEVGQTVNAGLSAPKLFLLAGDLARMHILANVDESDIGRIREGQAVTFTVQAFPDRVFPGEVRQVRLQSATAESVVTYTVVVGVDNAEGVLLPGMTTTVEFQVAEVKDTVCVSSAALRYRPDDTVPIVGADPAAEGAAASPEGAAAPAAAPAAVPGAPAAAAAPTSRGSGEGRGGRGGRGKKGGDDASGTLWVADGAGLRALPVTVGLRGATCVEVAGDGVAEGLVVVTGVERADAAGGPVSPLGASGSSGQRRPGGF